MSSSPVSKSVQISEFGEVISAVETANENVYLVEFDNCNTYLNIADVSKGLLSSKSIWFNGEETRDQIKVKRHTVIDRRHDFYVDWWSSNYGDRSTVRIIVQL